MSVNIVTDTELTVCISLSLSPGPNQLQCLLAAQLLQASQYTCNRSDQNLGAGEREMGTLPGPASLSDDLNISQQSRSRAAEREIRRKLSLSLSLPA